jgi:pyruvate formate lyase activating enzyme
VSEGAVCEDHFCPANDTVNAALSNKCASISYTYTEPTIFFEYCLDTAKAAKEKGLANVFVTNGYMTTDALSMIKPYLDAANVDLKFFNDASYKKICAGSLKPVQETIKFMRKNNIWVEVTTLVVPGSNDTDKELRHIAEFLARVDKDMPWHISRFFPNYQFKGYDPTAEGSLQKAYAIGQKAGLRYIYVGNVYGWGNSTFCHNCKNTVIKREGFIIREYKIDDNACAYCKTPIPGRFGFG